MRSFRDLPIRIKLALILVVVVTVALVLAGAAFVSNDIDMIKASLVDHLTALADVTGENSTAVLRFAQKAQAEEVLASLRLEPTVVFACLYDAEGKVFATYKRQTSDDMEPPPVRADGHGFTQDGNLEVFRKVQLNQRPIGAIYLRGSMAKVNVEIRERVLVSTVMLIAALSVAILLAMWLQRAISEPIRRLAQTAQEVSARGDYSLRAVKHGADEVGGLVDGFNAMLAQIQQRDLELTRHRQNLEELVQERTSDLEARTRELARSNAELELFASVASHDLQEPLRMVSSYVELLAHRYQGQLDDKADRWIRFAVEGTARMKQLINDLLEVARVGTRGKPLELTESATVFTGAVTNLEQAIRESGATVTHGALPTVLADRSQLTQVLQNLIGNALKFRGPQPPTIHVAAERHGDAWQFSVRDNGIGIDPQFAERIFIIFQRLHTREQYSGTGIGLAVCKKIIERHGGRIWVESQPGHGATFYFNLPAQEALQ